MEAFVALLEKDGCFTGLDLKQLTELSGSLERLFSESLPCVDSLSIATGYHGVFSGFKQKIIEAAKSFDVDPMDIIASLGKTDCWSRRPYHCNGIRNCKGANALMILKLHLLGGSGRVGRALVDSLVAQPIDCLKAIHIYCDSTKVNDVQNNYTNSGETSKSQWIFRV